MRRAAILIVGALSTIWNLAGFRFALHRHAALFAVTFELLAGVPAAIIATEGLLRHPTIGVASRYWLQSFRRQGGSLMLKTSICCVLATVWLAPAQVAQDTSRPESNEPQAQNLKMTFTPGTLIRAEIEKAVDAKKAQVGDPVLAKTVDDLNSNPPGLAKKGCAIFGHLVEVTPHQGDSPSTLGIVFDKMVLKDGTEMMLPATIQAIGVPDAGPIGNNSNDQIISNMGGNVGTTRLAGDIKSGSGDPTGYAGQTMPSVGVSHAKMSFQAKGVFGMSGVTLSTGTLKDSVLSSSKHNVKIEDGMQMILRTQ